MNTYLKTIATIILLSSTSLPAYCDQSQYPPPPQSLLSAPSIKGGELGQYSSVYPQEKHFWGDDCISQSLAKTGDHLKDLANKTMQQLTPQSKPNTDLAQAQYDLYKAQFERRAQQLNQEQAAQQAQALHQCADLYRWSGDQNTRR